MRKYIILPVIIAIGLIGTRCQPFTASAPARVDNLNLMFPDSTRESVVHQTIILDDLMKKLADRGKFTTQEIGYMRYTDALHFRNCFSLEKRHYIPADKCNVYELLSTEERQALIHGIDHLRSANVSGCYYEPVLNKILFIIDGPINEYGDARMLCLTSSLDTTFIKKTAFQIIDKADGLTLLKQKK